MANDHFKTLDYENQICYLTSLKIILELATEKDELTQNRASQGKTYKNKEKCCAAAHAIDKDLSTVAATHTGSGAGEIVLYPQDCYLLQVLHQLV